MPDDDDVPQRPTKRRKPKPELTLADIRRRKSGRVGRCTIQLDGEVANRLEELRGEFQRAKADLRGQRTADLSQKDRVGEIAREMEELVSRAAESEATFTFKAIGRHEFDALVSKYPPTKKDKDLAKQISDQNGTPYMAPEWNSETFPAALIAASSLEPAMTFDEAQALWDDDDWNGAELLKLFQTALMVNSQPGDVPFALRGIGVTPSTESKSTTASSTGSPGVSSSDE